jgi:hypothetical protein
LKSAGALNPYKRNKTTGESLFVGIRAAVLRSMADFFISSTVYHVMRPVLREIGCDLSHSIGVVTFLRHFIGDRERPIGVYLNFGDTILVLYDYDTVNNVADALVFAVSYFLHGNSPFIFFVMRPNRTGFLTLAQFLPLFPQESYRFFY